MFLISVTQSSVIIAGGHGPPDGKVYDSIEVISNSSNKKIKLPKLPSKLFECSMFIHNGSLMFCGGYNSNRINIDKAILRKCYQLVKGKWKQHSALNEPRYGASVVHTEKGTFLFGGNLYSSIPTYEYLPNDAKANEWKVGKKPEIPDRQRVGCAIEVKSKHQIWLIGGTFLAINGLSILTKILSFDINSETFQELPFNLNIGRFSHACAFIPGTSKILVTGGSTSGKHYDNSSEIIDTEDGSVTMAASMNFSRVRHAMGVINFNGEERLVVLGGADKAGGRPSTVELYNAKTDQWELSDIMLDVPRCDFGSVAITKV